MAIFFSNVKTRLLRGETARKDSSTGFFNISTSRVVDLLEMLRGETVLGAPTRRCNPGGKVVDAGDCFVLPKAGVATTGTFLTTPYGNDE